ncbi:hypothetical protein [Seonamhaeicola marinus]|uniref:Lipoprotein n=1 Tax=Seonamhaeicola marinus TaxID=1912246 RepID=A0A5D0I494_9FLAO|nr:hypothetical protein [Seonamhaeicola marinus]TYA78533.1 hypothetical protein FUA24_09260 [Seonamhaeicola marinus]
MFKKSIIVLALLFALSCGDKKEKKTITNEIEAKELKQEIDSIERITEQINNTEESIEASIVKLDNLLNEIED